MPLVITVPTRLLRPGKSEPGSADSVTKGEIVQNVSAEPMRRMRKTGQNSKRHVTKKGGGTYNADKSDKRRSVKASEKIQQRGIPYPACADCGSVMRWYAEGDGYGHEAEFWALVGLLHDVDFEQYPEEHCKKHRSFWRRLTPRRSLYTRL